jgi:hypothetical protein
VFTDAEPSSGAFGIGQAFGAGRTSDSLTSQQTSGFTVDEGLGMNSEGPCYPDGLEAFVSDTIPATLSKIRGRRWVCELLLVDPNMCDDAKGIFHTGPSTCIPNSSPS